MASATPETKPAWIRMLVTVMANILVVPLDDPLLLGPFDLPP